MPVKDARHFDTSKVKHRGANSFFRYGSASMNGRRLTNEDAHLALIKKDFASVGIFDGHRGSECARFASAAIRKGLIHRLERSKSATSQEEHHVHASSSAAATNKSNTKTEAPLGESISTDDVYDLMQGVDRECLEHSCQKTRESGSTAAMLLVEPVDASKTQSLTVVHAGDSRVLLGSRRKRQLIAATEDHSPNAPTERARIERAGGAVCPRTGRINDMLAVSRALGNSDFKQDTSRSEDKQLVVSIPDVAHYRVDRSSSTQTAAVPTIDMGILCCDGIFEAFKGNEELLQFVAERWAHEARQEAKEVNTTALKREGSAHSDQAVASPSGPTRRPDDLLASVAGQVCQEAFDRGSTDNLSCMIVDLEPDEDSPTPIPCDIDEDGVECCQSYIDLAPLHFKGADPHYIESIRHISEDIGGVPLASALRLRHEILCEKERDNCLTEAESAELHEFFNMHLSQDVAAMSSSANGVKKPNSPKLPPQRTDSPYRRLLAEWQITAQKGEELQLDLGDTPPLLAAAAVMSSNDDDISEAQRHKEMLKAQARAKRAETAREEANTDQQPTSRPNLHVDPSVVVPPPPPAANSPQLPSSSSSYNDLDDVD